MAAASPPAASATPDATTPEALQAHPVVLFDGVCNLCHGTVAFVIARDARARFRFAPLQSDVGATLLRRAGLREDALDGVVLCDGDHVWQRSDAAIRLAAGLGGAWPLVRALLLVPRPIRNLVYDWVVRHRYRWFGQRDSCPVPTPELRARFLA